MGSIKKPKLYLSIVLSVLLSFPTFGGMISTANALVAPVTVSSLWGNDYQMCGVLSSGAVECWGMNSYGSLGGNNDLQTQLPVRVVGIGNAVSVAVGNAHACALLADGSIKCWGSNAGGQLGNASTLDSLSAVVVSGISTAIAVTAGYGHSCALLQGGAVKCWGENSYGQVGDGTFTSRNTPVSVSLSAPALSIDAQVRNTCAVLSSGSVSCWGSNDWGMLGAGTGSSSNWTSTKSSSPVAVSGISNATAVDVGAPFACALLSTGEVKCWGSNGDGGPSGTLGNAQNGGSSNIPVSVAGMSDAISISTGTAGGCVIRSNQTLSCWGSRYPSIPTEVPALSSVTSVRVGSEHICVLLASGRVKCWGRTDVLGRAADYSPGNQQADPVYVPLTRQSIDFPSISATKISEQTLGITAQSDSGLSVVFSSQTLTVCTVSGTTVTFLKAGTCAVRALQPGDDIYMEAIGTTNSFEILGATPTITIIGTTSVWIEDGLVNATVISGGLDTAVWVQYGLSPTFNSNILSTMKSSVIGPGISSWTSNISGLLPSSTYYYRVLASNSLGEFTSGIKTFDTRTPIGISVNQAANYTISPEVLLSVSWPKGATGMIISNDGGFNTAVSKSFDVIDSVAWKLDNSVSGIYTKVVYIRFSGGGFDSSRTYQDDIIFDNTAPSVSSSSASKSGSMVVISLAATDKESGLANVEVRNAENIVMADYASKILIPERELGLSVKSSGVSSSSTSSIRIRVTDKAGNQTAWIDLGLNSTTLRVNSSLSFVAVMKAAKILKPKNGKVTLTAKSSICRVVAGRLFAFKAGKCKITFVLLDAKKKETRRLVSLKVG